MIFFPFLLISLLVCSDELSQSSRDFSEQSKSIESDVTNQQSTKEKKSITLTNNIDENMLIYKHWTGSHKPEQFSIHINDMPLKQGEHYELSSHETPIFIRYEYSFVNGLHKGSKTISYQIEENCTQAFITFSWKSDPRIIVSNASLIKK